jgi:glycosyltransferase involved in cell wall biosynthesis
LLRVLHVIETIAPREGGPPRVVAGLARAQRSLGIDAHVLCGDGGELSDHLRFWLAHAPGFPADSVHAIGTRGQALSARRRDLHEWLQAHLGRFDLVHVHQLWRLVPTLTAHTCRRHCTPYLVAPHTSLSPWALGQKRLKKTLARWLVWNRILAGAAGLHALNELEASEIRACLGPAGPPVFVVPNGVSLAEFPVTASARAPGRFCGLLSPPEGPAPYILFLARLHHMKGPELLLEAFACIARERPALRLVFAGPDFGMLATLQERTRQLEIADRVHFPGFVSGSERLWLLANAVCLCQPSRDEGFSLSILEAMACARPVVISERCKFPEVVRAGAGLIVPTSAAELAAALRVYPSDLERCAADGRAARALIERRYTWEVISRQAADMYRQAMRRDVGAAARRGQLE